MKRVFVSIVTAFCLLVGLSGTADAFGVYNYLAPWGCNAQFTSQNNGGNRVVQTQKIGGSCADMFASFRHSGGGQGPWHSHPTYVYIDSTASNIVGGYHKVCSGCTRLQT